MKRRRGRGSSISLFAFQDVMAAVIGILFFVVLLMALDVVDAVTPAAGETAASETQVSALREEVGRLEADVQRALAEAARLAERNKLVALGDRAILDDVRDMDAKLRVLLDVLQRHEGASRQLAGDVDAKETKVTEVKRQLERVRSELAGLQQGLKAARSTANIAYILDDAGGGPAPWLVELSAGGLRVAARDGRTSVLSFGGGSAQARQKAFLEWARGQDAKKRYFVILIKPSGVRQAKSLMVRLRGLGFDMGTDLLPEDWKPFEY